jgi:serine/threonine protein kinase
MMNRTVKNFQIKELIATGGMAAIYKAIQVSLDRVVAVKILHGHLAQDKNFITRFEREAKAAANLKHENIVNIIDYGKAEDVYFIAMEYIDGRSLKELMSSVKFMPMDIALSFAYEISKGLAHAHQKGMVHRDIKPANVLIGYDGTVKIADFGLAQAQDLISVTVTGSIVGTPAYMSPEQAAGKKVDNRTDIFSLGVVIYEMITGNKPFCGDNYSSVIHEIITVKPPKPLDANPLINREINDVIERMIEKDLDNRYQDITEVGETIHTYFKKNKVDVSKKLIGNFVSEPDEHFKDIIEKRREKHFERGLYFMTLGYAKIDAAINEFTKVLHLSPNHAQAKKHLSELKRKKEQMPPAKKVEKKPSKRLGKKTKFFVPIFVLVGCIVIAMVVYALWKKRQGTVQPTEDTVESFGFADIRSTPDNAAIYLDDEYLQLTTPAVLNSLVVGEHTVRLIKPGYLDYTRSIDVKQGDTISLKPFLVKEEEQILLGSILVRSTPLNAVVYLDNNNTGLKTPCTLTNVPVGKHRIKLVKKSYAPKEVSRDVVASKQVTVDVVLTKQETAPVSEKQFSYLKINVKPWAKIYIDGKYLETTPIGQPIRVTSGVHTLRLENPNFEIWQEKITLAPNQTVNMDIKLAVRDGHLKLTVKPWADVYIDGKYYETTPIVNPIKLSAGKHALKLINPSYKTVEQQIDIPPGKMLKKYVELQPK